MKQYYLFFLNQFVAFYINLYRMLLRQTRSFFTRITNIDFKTESRTVPLLCTIIKLTNIRVNCPLKLPAFMRQFSWYFHCNCLWFETKSSVTTLFLLFSSPEMGIANAGKRTGRCIQLAWSYNGRLEYLFIHAIPAEGLGAHSRKRY